MIPRYASEYRAMVGDLANALTEVSVPRARAEIRKLVGELRVDELEDRVEIRAAQSPEAALLRIAGAPEQICVVAGG